MECEGCGEFVYDGDELFDCGKSGTLCTRCYQKLPDVCACGHTAVHHHHDYPCCGETMCCPDE